MTAPQFIAANLRDHRSDLLRLNVEYMSWSFAEIDAFFGVRCAEVIGMDAPDYAASVVDKLCDRKPPEGIFYLIRCGDEFAGMGGLRGLTSEVAEIKRIYLQPAFRGAQLGERMLERLLADATKFGYQRVCLDSAPFMKAAHRLYEAAAFVDRAPYLGAEVPEFFHPQWRFMERPLASCGEA
jgi:GNAT superfamily N-acetyltransferase